MHRNLWYMILTFILDLKLESNFMSHVSLNFLNFGVAFNYTTKIEEPNLIFFIFCAKCVFK